MQCRSQSGGGLSFCGHALTEGELDLIRRITREFANLTVTELAATLCELLEWRRPNGGLKSRECCPGFVTTSVV